MLFRGTILAVSRDNTCCFVMFAYGQTTVCLHANSCLAIGKRCEIGFIVPQGILNGSSMHAPLPPNSV